MDVRVNPEPIWGTNLAHEWFLWLRVQCLTVTHSTNSPTRYIVSNIIWSCRNLILSCSNYSCVDCKFDVLFLGEPVVNLAGASWGRIWWRQLNQLCWSLAIICNNPKCSVGVLDSSDFMLLISVGIGTIKPVCGFEKFLNENRHLLGWFAILLTHYKIWFYWSWKRNWGNYAGLRWLNG